MRKKIMVALAATVVAGLMSCNPDTFAQKPAENTRHLHLNKIIDKLERRLLVTGIWVNCLHPSTAIAIARLNGFPDYEESLTKPMIDFILIDMEHEPFDASELRDFLLAMNSRREVMAKGNVQPNVAALVRIPQDAEGPIEWMIKQVLDAGAHGVVVPHVRNVADAQKVVAACRYLQPKNSPIAEPKGKRGAAPRLCSYLWGISYGEYVERADVWPLNPKGDLLTVIMIEDEQGVKNLDRILDVKGIGAVMFGPFDYSFTAGQPARPSHPVVTKTWDQVRHACDKHEVPIIGFANPRNIELKVTQNHRMLLIGEDYDLTGKAAGVLDYLEKTGAITKNAQVGPARQ